MRLKLSYRALTAACAAALLSLPAAVQAQEHRHEGGHDERHFDGDRDVHHFEGGRNWHGDIHAFHEHDIELWRSGRWFHGPHDGRPGWWWIVGGVWYFYPSVVYPYPDPYQPPVVVLPPEQIAAPPHYYYYCSNPGGYYPYVARCLVPWSRVTSAPPVAVQPQEGMPPPQ